MSVTEEQVCAGRVCLVTGAGRGIGKEHALALAEAGAAVVVNDRGGDMKGGGGDDITPAEEVAALIRQHGGQATADFEDISAWDGAQRAVAHAIAEFGKLDVVVNNAGILRDRMVVNMTEDEWDSVIRVHLKGTFAVTRHAAAHWRDRSSLGEPVDARVINTTSVSGLYANPGQANYGAAKAGIAAFTQIVAQELARYGATANAIAPGALTRMTEQLGFPEDLKDRLDPKWIAPVCVWLASPLSSDITGQVIEASGLTLAVAEGWHRGPSMDPITEPAKLDRAVRELLTAARARTTMAEVS